MQITHTLCAESMNCPVIKTADKAPSAKGFVCLSSDNKLIEVALNKSGNALMLASDPLVGKVTWRLRTFSEPIN